MYIQLNTKNGFTVLELLIVIAIIGILAIITLSYLGRTKDKADDVGVQSNVVNARSKAEVFYAQNGNSYEGVCAMTGPYSIGRQIRAAARAQNITPQSSYTDTTPSGWNTEACHDSEEHYAAWVPLQSSTLGSPIGWCIDSRNFTRQVNVVLNANATQCL